MPKGYHHLTYAQRCQISILMARGDSFRLIARALNVHHTTISRELQRNRGLRGYRHKQAQEKASFRRPPPNKKMDHKLLIYIEEKLKEQWSPIQISGWLMKHDLGHISHESIYKHIWKDKVEGGSLYKQLRHNGKKYNKRRKGTSGRGCIPGRMDISQRPKIVEEKSRLGDWELDTIIGARHCGAIVSMVERTSKLTKLVKVDRKTADAVEKALIEKLSPLKPFVHTMTSDNGKEFTNHQKVSASLDAGFYFAAPYHSWERGLNEHTNGLVRQYFPKSQSFAKITSYEIEHVEALLNNRPRKVLGFETPLETFSRLSKNVIYSEVQ